MKKLFTYFAICLMIAGCSFYDDSKINNSDLNIPALIVRTDKIKHGKEWDDVQNVFQNQKLRLSKNPTDFEARINVALLYIKEARVTGEHGFYYPSALAQLEKVLENEKAQEDVKFRALTIKAGVQLSLHDFTAARETAEKALALNDKNAQLYGALVDANVELGKYKEAVLYCDKMVGIKPDLRSYSRVSYLREIHGDIDGSIDAMKMAVKAGIPGTEETAWTMQTLGDIYLKYGKSEAAEATFKEILSTRSDYPFAIDGLANVAKELGKYREAEVLYEQAISVIPEVGFYINLADLYKKENRTEELKKIKTEILEMLKDDTDHDHNMNMEYADVYLNLFDNPEQARNFAMKEYIVRPENIDVNLMMAKIHKALGEEEMMKKYTVAALVTNSKNPELTNL